MKTMKVLTLCCLLSLGFFCNSASAQMYIVMDKFSGTAEMDSVYVISPTGETTKYAIAYISSNNGHGILTHYKQLNVILNSVISLGYKLLFKDDLISVSSGQIYYFAKP